MKGSRPVERFSVYVANGNTRFSNYTAPVSEQGYAIRLGVIYTCIYGVYHRGSVSTQIVVMAY